MKWSITLELIDTERGIVVVGNWGRLVSESNKNK
jgi:hypothetical protein